MEHSARAWLAWHVAALGRVRRLPKLAAMQKTRRRATGTQDWQQQIGVIRMINAAFGGIVRRGKPETAD